MAWGGHYSTAVKRCASHDHQLHPPSHQPRPQLARSWGCSAIALHVDPSNEAAYALYKNNGYREVMEEPWLMRFLEGSFLCVYCLGMYMHPGLT